MPFAALGLDPRLSRAVADLGYTTPTPVQKDAIPAGVAGRDVLAAAMTGSGKTAAFMLPILHRLLAAPKPGTRVLVLTPTRELAAQILDATEGFARYAKISAAAIFGGVGMGPQEEALRRGVSILIATPGRLLDHLGRPGVNLDKLDYLVIDEADRMLDMGFLPDVRRVLARLPRERQTLFFSATLPNEVKVLSKDLLRDPVLINVERQAAPAKGVTQALWPVPEHAKSALLLAMLERGILGSVIVFSRTKHRTNRLSEYLEKRGVANARIHGNRSQAQRTAALADFKAGKLRVLCATDIVARGIDVEELEHVVNFDVPNIPADYIHRVGRTARADAVGEAFTFVAPDDEGDVRAIEKAIGARIPRRTLEDFDYGQRPAEALEIPLGERIAAIRARKQEERSRAREKEAARSGRGPAAPRAATPPRPPGGGAPKGPPRADDRGPRRDDRGPRRDDRGPRRDDRGPRRDDRGGDRLVASSAPPEPGGSAPPRPAPSWRRPGGADAPAGPRDPDAQEVRPGVWRRGGR